ncbi:MAG: hypothetical protein ACOYON_03950 [Fimbriimonas sp.]
MYRRDQKFVVWDERGLTIRIKDKVLSTTLGYIPTHPKLFAREEILRTIDLLKSGERSRPAAGISGSVRVGGDVYFLVRWENAKKEPWLEALLRVNIGDDSLKPELVGKFGAASLGRQRIDDCLMVLDGRLGVVGRQSASWGLASYDLKEKAFDFATYGDTLQSFDQVGKIGLFSETTAYGTQVAGQIQVVTGERKVFAEGHGLVRFLDAKSQKPSIIVLQGDQTELRNSDNGASLLVPSGWTFVGIEGDKVLGWNGASEAKLWDPERWTVLARFSRG